MTQAKLVKATLIDRKQLNDHFYQLSLQLSEPVEHQAGQYINLKLQNQFRPYSISILPNQQNLVELCVDAKPGGLGSQFAQNAPLKTTIDALFPLGRFLLNHEDKPSLFLATGSGIAPFKAMIKQLLELRQTQHKVKLLWGMRFEKDLFWEEEWSKLKKQYPNFTYNFCLSREESQQPNNPCRFYGYTTQVLKKEPDLHNWHFYLCGSKAMLDSTTKILTDNGVQTPAIHFEKFY